jgi:hypothetical protein
MYGFVDYGKRSGQLLPGCKDLIDVLKLTREIRPDFRRWDSISGWMPPGGAAGVS